MFRIHCKLCEYLWEIDAGDMIAALAKKTGYICDECAPIENSFFSARPCYDNSSDGEDDEEDCICC